MHLQPFWKKPSATMTWALLLAFIACAYLPLILKGGIIADDWGDIAQNLICNGFFECYRSWFPLFSNRPLAPLPITTTTLLFGLHFGWYLVFNTAIYLIAIFITANVLKSLFKPFAVCIFIILASIPMIAMPIVVSPINQSTATQAFLLWALSLYLLKSYCDNGKGLSYCFSYVLALASLLTYEVMLPLFAFTVALPLCLNSKKFSENPVRYFFKFISPIILALGAALIWQKVLAPSIFTVVHSRLAFDPNNIGLLFLNWLNVFYIGIPQLIIKSFKRIDVYAYVVSMILVLALTSLWIRQKRDISNEHQYPKNSFVIALALLVCLISSSTIFILSGSIAEIGGNDARALSSTWLSLALLIACLLNYFSKKVFALVLGVVICCTSYLAFGVQRDNYIRSWQLQTTILKDVLEKVGAENIPPNATIIGNVPGYLPNNFNNEIVFTQPWDFGAALSLYTNKKIAGGAVLDTKASNFSKPIHLADERLTIDRWWGTDISNLWFYDFDINSKTGNLVKIPDINALKRLLLSLGYLGEFESKSYVTTDSPINFSIDWLDRSKYIVSGWGERESWGGIWSTQSRATIKLPIPEDGAKSIRFNVNAFVNPTHPKQDLVVFINGQQAGKVTLHQFENNEISIPLPELTNKQLPISIDFEMPNAVSPKSLNLGNDDRKLGIGLKTATFY